jgi:uncharacterized protein YllA (UPF0747 family)
MRIHRQLPIARWSGILVEPRVDRTLDKYGADLAELLAPGAVLEKRVIRSQVPPALESAFRELRDSIEAHYARIEPVALGVDPTLKRPVEAARQHAQSESQDLEKRIVAHLKRRQETELVQIERARNAVFPDGKPQERVFGIAPFLARYGPGLLEQLAESVGAWYGLALEAEPQPS